MYGKPYPTYNKIIGLNIMIARKSLRKGTSGTVICIFCEYLSVFDVKWVTAMKN